MSTNASITMVCKDNTYKSIYCHWDGYPSGVGRILADNYNTMDKVEALIDLGDMSSIGEKLCPDNKQHSYDTPEADVCVFYHRDRNEDWENTKPNEMLSLAELETQHYNYLFDEKWYVANCCNLEKDKAFESGAWKEMT